MAEGPYAAEHILYQFQGTMPGGDIFSVGLRTVAATVDNVELDMYAAAAHTAFRTMWNATASWHAFNSAAVIYTHCTARLISTAGVTLLQSESATTADPGNAPGQTAPNQSALVVSLRTSAAGRRGKGRFYMPFVAPVFGTADDRVPDASLNPLVTATAVFISALNALTEGGTGPFPIAVQSRAIPASDPPVTRIAIGNVVDTQRRRRNAVREVYIESVV